jgi:hypothetical protein
MKNRERMIRHRHASNKLLHLTRKTLTEQQISAKKAKTRSPNTTYDLPWQTRAGIAR